jgi:hypothetical protein
VSETAQLETREVLTSPVKSTHHNAFERFHRFIGWLGLAVRDALAVDGESWADHRTTDNMGLRHPWEHIRYQYTYMAH